MKAILRAVLGAGFIALGGLHFLHLGFFVRMIPPPLSAHARTLVQISAVFEILGGAGICVPRARRFSGIGLLALLVAVFPANIYMAVRADLFADVASKTALLVRLPLQFVLMAGVWWSCLSE